MPLREYFYDESLSEQITTSDSFSDVMETEFFPNAGETWLFMHSILQTGQHDWTACQLQCQLDDFIINTSGYVPMSGNSYAECLYFYFKTFNSTGKVDSTIRFCSNDGYTSKVKGSRIFGLKLDSDSEKYAGNFTDTFSSTTSADWQNFVTLTFTPKKSGDYLILASCFTKSNNPNWRCRAILDVSGTEINEGQINDTTGGNTAREKTSICWSVVHKDFFPSTEQTIKIKFATSSSGNVVFIKHGCIIAIPLSNFNGSNYIAEDTRTTTNTTVVTKATLEGDFKKGNWLFLLTALKDTSSAASGSGINLETKFGITSHHASSERLWDASINNFIKSGGILAYQTNYLGDNYFSLLYQSQTVSDVALSYARIIAVNLDSVIYPRDQVRISAIDGNAFFDVSEYDTLTDCVGGEYKITVTDSTGKKLIGYIDQTKRGENYE